MILESNNVNVYICSWQNHFQLNYCTSLSIQSMHAYTHSNRWLATTTEISELSYFYSTYLHRYIHTYVHMTCMYVCTHTCTYIHTRTYIGTYMPATFVTTFVLYISEFLASHIYTYNVTYYIYLKEGNLPRNLAQPSLCPSHRGDLGILWGGHNCLPSPSGITHPGNFKGHSRVS